MAPKTAKNENDLYDFDFDHVTLRSLGYVDLVKIGKNLLFNDVVYVANQKKNRITTGTINLTKNEINNNTNNMNSLNNNPSTGLLEVTWK